MSNVINKGNLYLCQLGEILLLKIQDVFAIPDDFFRYQDHFTRCPKCHYEKENYETNNNVERA